jgi:transposase-like protein
MIPEDFKTYYLSLSTFSQQKIIDNLLEYKEFSGKVEDPNTHPISCSKCSGTHIVGNGKSPNGVQRYLCVECKKTFSSTTGKVWYNMQKKDKLVGYLHCLLSGYSIRKSGELVGISLKTSFDWRHKLLKSFENVSSDKFSGVVESDETYFLYSQKGAKNLDRPSRKRGNTANRDGINDEHVAVIVTMDRSGNKSMKVVKRGRVTTKDIQKELTGKISEDSVFCTDGHPSYAGFAKRENLTHKKIIASKSQRVVEKQYHVQNVNSIDNRLKKFMDKFNGVSSKYLQNYLNWFLVLEKVKKSTEKLNTMILLAFSSNTVWYEYKKLVINQHIFIT